MARWNPSRDYPQIHKTVYIDPTAVVIGRVKIVRNVFVGPGERKRGQFYFRDKIGTGPV